MKGSSSCAMVRNVNGGTQEDFKFLLSYKDADALLPVAQIPKYKKLNKQNKQTKSPSRKIWKQAHLQHATLLNLGQENVLKERDDVSA